MEKKVILEIQKGIKERYATLTEDEKDTIRANKGTPYAAALRKVFGTELLEGLRTGNPKTQVLSKGGLASR